MDRAERDQTLAVLAGEFPDETVHVLGEAHHFGSDVVDQARSLHPGGVEVTQERARIVDETVPPPGPWTHRPMPPGPAACVRRVLWSDRTIASESRETLARIPWMNCTFGSVAMFPPSFVRTFRPSCPRVIDSSPSYQKKSTSFFDATKRFQKLYSCSRTSRWRNTSTPATFGCRNASSTNCPRERAVADARPRRFDRATTRPVPLAPIHVPPALRSLGATMTGAPSITEGGSAARLADSSRFMPMTRS